MRGQVRKMSFCLQRATRKKSFSLGKLKPNNVTFSLWKSFSPLGLPASDKGSYIKLSSYHVYSLVTSAPVFFTTKSSTKTLWATNLGIKVIFKRNASAWLKSMKIGKVFC